MITVPGDFDIMCVECVLGTHSSADWFPRRVSRLGMFSLRVLYVRVPRDNNAYHALPIRIYRRAHGGEKVARGN